MADRYRKLGQRGLVSRVQVDSSRAQESSDAAEPKAPRTFWVLTAAAYCLLLVVVWPMARGVATLHLRDVMHSHLPLKLSQVEAWKQGYLPLVDLHRGGGQPSLGNPNGVPLYPDNALYLLADPLWALNAHFWIHWLLAPFAFAWLARRWGLSSRASAAGGLTYALSGYFLSQMNFYNLVAGVALAPALAAAALWVASGERGGRSIVALGLLWSLILLAGDPSVALLAFVLAATTVAARYGFRFGAQRQLAIGAAFVAGTLLAAVQGIELWRIVGLSFRGHQGFGAQALTASWDPRSAVDLLLPMPFGPPRLSFWGQPVYGDTTPLYWSLYPGLLVLVLMVCSRVGPQPSAEGSALRRWRTPALWSWLAIVVGVLGSLGRFNPLIAWWVENVGTTFLRFPVKFWLPVAIGSSLLAALGFDRTLGQGRCRPLLIGFAGLFGFFVGVLIVLHLWPALFPRLAEALMGRTLPPKILEDGRARWLSLSLWSALFAGLPLLTLLLLKRARPAAVANIGGGCLLFLHAGAQLFFLSSLVDTEEAALYEAEPPILRWVGADELIFHANPGQDLFDAKPKTRFPDDELRWMERRGWHDLYPFVGVLFGRRYDLNHSPEGLDSFLNQALVFALERLSDSQRVRLLRALGVDVVLTNSTLDLGPTDPARLRHSLPSYGGSVFVYEILDSATEVELVGNIYSSPHLNGALATLVNPRFNPHRDVVLAGEGPPLRGEGGTVESFSVHPERLEAAVEAVSPSVLIWRRAHLSLYRAAIDGQEVPVQIANLTRLGVEIPPGHHKVEIWVDRRSLWLGGALTLLGVVVLGTAARAFRTLATREAKGANA